MQDRLVLTGVLMTPLPLWLMILTADEVGYFENGGILPYVLRNLLAA